MVNIKLAPIQKRLWGIAFVTSGGASAFLKEEQRQLSFKSCPAMDPPSNDRNSSQCSLIHHINYLFTKYMGFVLG